MPALFEKTLLKHFAQHSDIVQAQKMEAYMKHKFSFFGIPSPLRKQIVRNIIAKQGKPADGIAIAKSLFSLPQRELHYVGQELLMSYKKQWNENTIEILEELITTNSWWDTVDFLAGSAAGHYFEKWPQHKEATVQRWNGSNNMWLVRSSILFQLKYKDAVDEELLQEMILPHISDKEFFIRKAIGWALRQYSKYSPKYVLDFVINHELQPLSEREALKHINRQRS